GRWEVQGRGAPDSSLGTLVQPDQKWTGKDLVEHLRRHDPVTLAVRQLLRQAAWQGDVAEARHWYAALGGREVSNAALLSDQARIQMAAGDPVEALRLARQSLGLEDDADTRALIDALLAVPKKENRKTWAAQLNYQ